MKILTIFAISILLISGCGEEGDDGVPTISLDSDPAIIAVDLTRIGSNETYYSKGVSYPVSGPGTVYWTDGITFWNAYLPIEPGTKGEDPPLFGLLLVDGEDGTAKGYFFYMGTGTYSFYRASAYPTPENMMAGVGIPRGQIQTPNFVDLK